MVSNIFILDEYLKTSKVLTINGQNTFFDDVYALDLSTCTETFEFTTNATGIEESNYVMFYYHGKYKLFQIVEIEQEHNEGNILTTIYAETACLELLNNVVRSFSGEYNCIAFLEHVLDGTDWYIGTYSSSLADKMVNVEVDKTTQIWSCIQDFMGNFGYEISPYVIYENGHVKSKVIDVFAEGELGDKTYKRFEYGRNVSGMVKKKDLYEWCTALIIDTEKDLTKVSYNEDGYVKELTSDVVLATNENKKYNLGRDYIYGSFDAKDCEDATEAVEKAVEELKRRATPHFDYECDTALTYEEYENINLGDTVYVIDSTFSPVITLEARIGNLEISFTDRTKCRCTLTNYKEVKSKINVELTGNIQEVINKYFPITSNGIADGAITDGKIDTTYYQQITADIVSASKVVAEQLIAQEVLAIDGKFENLETVYAKITSLDATNANVTNLTAALAEIQTLVGGNLTMDNIQSLVLTSDKVTVANAFIKDAMIDTVSANKINTGILNTNNVSIQSDDGSMLLQGNLQQFKDKNGKVRIQIGKDATGNFTFSLFDANGTGVLIDETGIKSGAVANGLIVDAMVSDNANISGGKIDIDSLITEVNNNNTTTIKGTKIYLDNQKQTLEVAFNQMKTTVENLKVASGDVGDLVEKVTTNTTNIEVAQGQISSLISNTTITKQDGTVVQLKDDYNSTKDTVNSHTTTIGSLETTVNSVSSKQSSLEQNLNGFKTTVSDTYLSKDEAGNTYATQTNLTQVEQTANKINWIVKSGTSSSSMTLTDELYNLVANNITLTADHITLEGLVTANEYFQILTDGSCQAKDISVDNTVSANNVSAEHLSIPWYDRCLTRNITVYITPGYTYTQELDESYFNDEAVFASFADLMNVCPRNLNGYILDIYMTANVTENVGATMFHSGRLRINMQGHSLMGYIRFYGQGLKCLVYGNAVGSTGGTTRGSIVPGSVGYAYGDYRYGIQCDGAELTVYDVDFYAGKASDKETSGIACSNGCKAYLSAIKAVNTPRTLVRANSYCHVYVASSSGLTSNYAFQAVSGSMIMLNTTTQCGRSGSSSHTGTSNNGQIFSTGVTWGTASATGTTNNTNTTTTETKTVTIKSDTGRSWRTSGSYANSWSSDAVVRQGRWSSSYGDNTGYWFFGNDIYSILQNSSNTITSMKVKITRNSGGQNAAVTHYLRAHTHKSKPSSTPSLLGTGVINQSFNLAVGNSTTITLSSSQIANLKSNKVKGFGLYTSSTSQSGYSCCSATMTVTITYKTTE